MTRLVDEITVLILTFNESPNICRTLDRLRWAQDIVIVDSFSTDNTVELVKKYPQVRLFQRHFDSHANQWNYAASETSINTEWILALDADYVLSDAVVNELDGLEITQGIDAYRASFQYCIFGRPLSGALYPPVTVLYKKARASYIQDGHTQRVEITGRVGNLKALIMHDDRKPLSSWLQAQDRYMRLEANLLSNKKWSKLDVADKLRKLIVVAPMVTFFYCLLVKRGLLDGKAGLYYAIQRSLAEAILSLQLIELRLYRNTEL